MHGIAAIGSNRAVAVGFDEDKDRKVPAAWSYDSAEWKRVLAPRFGDVGSGDGSVGAFHGVAADGETVVAVGVAGPSQAEEDALVWTFFDDAWHRVCREECGNSVNGGGSDGQGMWAVVNRSNGGFVAVGYDVIKEEKTSFDAAVWTSPDGRRWGRVPADPDVFGGAGNQVMRAVTETRSNLLVAVGVDDLTGAVWTSPDGQAWNRVGVDAFDPLPESDRTELRGIIEQEDNQLVAVGIDRQKRNVRAAAWVSSGDLGEWQRIQTSAFPRDRIDQHALGAASNGQRTVAVGYDHVPRDSDHRVAAAWLVDGETVQPIQNRDFRGPGNREINAAALLADGRLVAVGDGPSPEGPANEQDARVWIATPRH